MAAVVIVTRPTIAYWQWSSLETYTSRLHCRGRRVRRAAPNDSPRLVLGWTTLRPPASGQVPAELAPASTT